MTSCNQPRDCVANALANAELITPDERAILLAYSIDGMIQAPKVKAILEARKGHSRMAVLSLRLIDIAAPYCSQVLALTEAHAVIIDHKRGLILDSGLPKATVVKEPITVAMAAHGYIVRELWGFAPMGAKKRNRRRAPGFAALAARMFALGKEPVSLGD